MTKATYNHPCQVGTWVKSDTHSRLGRSALNCRLARSSRPDTGGGGGVWCEASCHGTHPANPGGASAASGYSVLPKCLHGSFASKLCEHHRRESSAPRCGEYPPSVAHLFLRAGYATRVDDTERHGACTLTGQPAIPYRSDRLRINRDAYQCRRLLLYLAVDLRLGEKSARRS